MHDWLNIGAMRGGKWNNSFQRRPFREAMSRSIIIELFLPNLKSEFRKTTLLPKTRKVVVSEFRFNMEVIFTLTFIRGKLVDIYHLFSTY